MTCEEYKIHTVSKKGIPLDMIGRQFGRLVVLGLIDQSLSRDKNRTWLCKCECGVKKPINGSDLRGGGVNSCGCLRKEKNRKRLVVHGNSTHPLYGIWQGMIARCTNPRMPNFHHYGGRGITVCQRWIEDFNNFVNDIGERPSQKHSIDRIDNNGGYSPENCRWATTTQQANNKRHRLPRFIGSNHNIENLDDWLDGWRNHKNEFIRKTELIKSLEQQKKDLTTKSFRIKSKDKNQIEMFV